MSMSTFSWYIMSEVATGQLSNSMSGPARKLLIWLFLVGSSNVEEETSSADAVVAKKTSSIRSVVSHVPERRRWVSWWLVGGLPLQLVSLLSAVSRLFVASDVPLPSVILRFLATGGVSPLAVAPWLCPLVCVILVILGVVWAMMFIPLSRLFLRRQGLCILPLILQGLWVGWCPEGARFGKHLNRFIWGVAM